MLSTIRLMISLMKLRAGLAIAATALVGVAATDGPAPSWPRIIGIGLAVLGASCATGAFNHYYERDLDRLMQRTRRRPFASGLFQPRWWWPVGFLALLAASLALAAGAGGKIAAGCVFLGAFTYGIVYTVWLKRRSLWNIVAGGLGGSFVVLAGAAVVDATPNLIPTTLAFVVFLWAMPHFWTLAAARSDDYRRANIPMLPSAVPASTWSLVILLIAAVLYVISLVPLLVGFGGLYGLATIAGGAYLVWRSWQLHRAPTSKNAIATFFASLTQLGLLFVGVILERVVRGWA